MSGPGFKAGARKLILTGAPRLFLISFVFVLVLSVLSESSYRLSGASGVYQRYIERVASGDPHSAAMLFSLLSPVRLTLAALLTLLFGAVRAGFYCCCLTASRTLSGVRGGENLSDGGGELRGEVHGRLRNEVREVHEEHGFINIIRKTGLPLLGKLILILITTAALAALWSLLFFFPGVVAHYRYRLAYYILIDDPGKSVLTCIRESKALTRGNKLDLFLIDLSFLGWHFLNFALVIALIFIIPVALPVVFIWILPYEGFTRALLYDHLLDNAAS